MEYQTKSDYHSDGLLPKRVRIDGKRTVRFSGSLAANAKDRQRVNKSFVLEKLHFGLVL